MSKLKLDSKMSNCTEDLSVSNVRSSILWFQIWHNNL